MVFVNFPDTFLLAFEATSNLLDSWLMAMVSVCFVATPCVLTSSKPAKNKT